MSVIERAAKRLEELRKAGITVRSPKLAQDVASGFPSAGIEPAEALPEDSRVAADARPRAATDQEQLPTAVSKSVSIDLARLAASGFVTPEDPRSQVAEEFRVIKRPLIRNAMGKTAAPIRNGNLIMITSAFPGEGKSTCSVNLAISIAMELRQQGPARGCGCGEAVDSYAAGPFAGTRSAGHPDRPEDQSQRRAAQDQRRTSFRCSRAEERIRVRPNCSPATRWPDCCRKWRTAIRIESLSSIPHPCS